MKISIIIPVYNVEAYVGQCLQSVFDGDPDESQYEVIVVNDGTPDHSMDVVRRVCKDHRNVKILEQDNQGLSAARMAGLKEAEGEFVWFVDSDDWLEKGALASIRQMIARHPHINVFTMPLIWVESGSMHYDFEIDEDIQHSGKELLQTQYPLSAAQRFVIDRNLFQLKSLYFPIGLIHEDEYFYRALMYHAPNVLLMKSSVYYYRQRENSIMSSPTIRSLYDCISIFRHLKTFLQTEVEQRDYRWFQLNITSFLLLCFKKSFMFEDEAQAIVFRKQNRFFVLQQCCLCRSYTVKEKIWIFCLMYFPARMVYRAGLTQDRQT